MLLTKEVEVELNGTNVKHYEELGYEILREKKWKKWSIPTGTKIKVKIEDVPKGSHTEVQCLCDYCLEKGIRTVINKRYQTHIRENKDICGKCSKNKIKEIHALEIQTKVKETFDLDITKDGYYDLKNVQKVIEYFISKNNRFPNTKEMLSVLFISNSISKMHGGMTNIQKTMGYKKEDLLVDDSGMSNRSVYEYYTAMFLLGFNISFKREQSPFPKGEGLFRSDFTFYLENNKTIHCEVWGYPKELKSSLGIAYNKNRKIKEILYEKHNVEYISIEHDVFINGLEHMQTELKNIFNDFIINKDLVLSVEYLLPPYKLSDTQILERMMKFSEDKNTLPSCSHLRDIGQRMLYEEVIKRYKTYKTFADKFDKKLLSDVYWDTEKAHKSIYDICNELNKDVFSNNLLEKVIKNNNEYSGLGRFISYQGDFVDYFLDFIEIKIINENEMIADDIMKKLVNLTFGKYPHRKNKVTDFQIEKSKYLLNLIKEKQFKEVV